MLLVLVALSGCSKTIQLAALQSLATAIAPADVLSTAVSAISFAQRAVGAIGAIASGLFLVSAEPGWVFVAAAVPAAAATILYATLGSTATQNARPATGTADSTTLLGDFTTGFRALGRIPVVVQLLLVTVIAEVFGFAFNAFTPVLVSELLQAGPDLLGGIAAAIATGAMISIGVLSVAATRMTSGPVLIGVVVTFGLAIAAFANCTIVWVAIALAACLGGAAALIDSLQWALLQANVPQDLRGRVLGAWHIAIGFGWLGPILIGAVAEFVGIGVALTAAGLIVVSSGLAATRSDTLMRVTG